MSGDVAHRQKKINVFSHMQHPLTLTRPSAQAARKGNPHMRSECGILYTIWSCRTVVCRISFHSHFGDFESKMLKGVRSLTFPLTTSPFLHCHVFLLSRRRALLWHFQKSASPRFGCSFALPPVVWQT